MNIRLVGAGIKSVSTCTGNGAGYIVGMDIFLHGSLLSVDLLIVPTGNSGIRIRKLKTIAHLRNFRQLPGDFAQE